uniref:Uncharacterized protein n=1 Tax=Anguilla anguilla TaxID=7936 RepID=A0A0E9T685_ANGAN
MTHFVMKGLNLSEQARRLALCTQD